MIVLLRVSRLLRIARLRISSLWVARGVVSHSHSVLFHGSIRAPNNTVVVVFNSNTSLMHKRLLIFSGLSTFTTDSSAASAETKAADAAKYEQANTTKYKTENESRSGLGSTLLLSTAKTVNCAAARASSIVPVDSMGTTVISTVVTKSRVGIGRVVVIIVVTSSAGEVVSSRMVSGSNIG